MATPLYNPRFYAEAYDHWEKGFKSNGERSSSSPTGDFGSKVELIDGNIGDGVEVEKLEFYAKENAKSHHTLSYDIVEDFNAPVLRRARTFFMAIKTKDRPIEFLKDVWTVIFEFGPHPTESGGTKVGLPIDNKRTRLNSKEPEVWDAVLYKVGGYTTILEVQIGSKAPVGIWTCRVETAYRRSPQQASLFQWTGPVYVIFNPFDRDDAVHMENERLRSETVQNDVGKVYKGTHNNVIGTPWVFGQHESTVLPACCFLLDNSGLNSWERGDPVKVARALSAMINQNDDDGVMVGRWGAPYSDGTEPWKWNGSVAILQEYMESGGRPVRYGQCWVFSALVVTVCRALGIPCRSVTNYVSAHDTNKSLTIDRFFDEDGDEITQKNPDPNVAVHDSIWNFHVWNDVWMARSDLPVGYGGWQAVDATPQEASGGRYQCGPAPLAAVKRGEVQHGFDTDFVFSMTNADVCHFVADPKSSWGYSRSKLNTYHVGRKIVTRCPGPLDERGNGDLDEITLFYKPEEGTSVERMAVLNAVDEVDLAKRYYYDLPEEQHDVHIKLIDLEKVKYGQPYKVRIVLENKSRQIRTLKAVVTTGSVYYTGIPANPIKRADGEFALAGGQSETLALQVHPEEYMDQELRVLSGDRIDIVTSLYMDQLVEYCMVKCHAMVRVKETNQTWSDEDDFVMDKPKLSIRVDDRLAMWRRGRVQVSLANPLSVPLTRCSISVEVAGSVTHTLVNDVRPGATVVEKLFVLPRRAGPTTLVATFSSEELFDVKGSAKVDIIRQHV